MKELFTLRDFYKTNKWAYILGILWLLGTDLLQMITPRLLGQFTDTVQSQGATPGLIWKYANLIVLVAVGVALFRFLWRIYILGTARRLEYYIRDKLFKHLQTLSPSFYDHRKTGDLMAHGTNDINAVRASMGIGIVMLVDSVFLTIMAVVLMLTTIDWKLTLIALIPLPLLALVALGLGRQINVRFRVVQETFSRLSERVQENISGIRVIKAFAREKAETKRFSGIAGDYILANMHLIRVWGLFDPLVFFISSLSFIIALVYGGGMVMQGALQLGSLVAFISYQQMLTWPMIAIGWVINVIQRGSASMGRLNVLLGEQPEIKDGPGAMPVEKISGKIEFRNLNFSYPGTHIPVLKNINISLLPGETLAVVGPTGSGKSTLAALLLRLYNPPPGTIFIDGIDIYRIPLEQLRQAIGCVPQDNFLFSKTIAHNIAFGRPGASLPEIEKAARAARVYDDIEEFLFKFDTVLGERGVTLSGGQKQRVSIARALLKNPSIFILDDAFSAVDTQTEEAILLELKPRLKGKTAIIISHRISTVKDAGQIVVLKRGEIVEQGTHQELLERGGLYADLYEKQQLEEKLASEG
ncbi:MAG: ABC transporter ATP-binding protein [Dethiobacteria bacterium]|jgi:ATP-binding cassette subfamily B multidrug efflux pump|nr:ABC transporter ATP-binding protein [Bacillota bacterium]